MDLSALDDYSRNFAALLFATYPEWISHATEVIDPRTQHSYLQVVVPAPKEADVTSDLHIETMDEQITIGLDETHWHIKDWNVEDYSGELSDHVNALEDIASILAEKSFVYLVWKNDKPAGGGFSDHEELPFLDAARLESFIRNWKLGPNNAVRIRSWKGSLNSDFCLWALSSPSSPQDEDQITLPPHVDWDG